MNLAVFASFTLMRRTRRPLAGAGVVEVRSGSVGRGGTICTGCADTIRFMGRSFTRPFPSPCVILQGWCVDPLPHKKRSGFAMSMLR